jgi:nitrite reductase/ring-hydroxylating ferredoxin subunit
MFEGYANVWTPVTLARRLKKKPLPVELAGEKLVFFRDAEGKAGALIDRCPHRGVKLSLGKVENGCLTCPFHAWAFDAKGEATHVPLNPDAKRERLFALSVPVREIGGVLWAYTAVVKEAPVEPMVPDALVNDACAFTLLEVEWNCHWTRAMENMLDSPHVPFVHKATIGRFMQGRLRRDSSMEITWEEQPWGGRAAMTLDGSGGLAWLDYYAPNTMVLNIPIPGKLFRMHAMCVPAGKRTTRMIVIGARNFATLGLLNPLFNLSNKRIVNEDQAVVESSDPFEVPPARDEVSVRTDKATLKFRKHYFDTLKDSSAAPPPRSVVHQALQESA